MEWVVLLFVIVIFFIVLTKRVSGLAAQACSACTDQGTSYRYKNSSDCSTLGCRCEQEACPVGSVRSSTDDKTCVPTSCPVGQTLSGNACVPCPAGTYKNNTGTGACTPCTNSSTGRYVSAACTSTADTQFSSWPSCRAGQHLEGYDLGSATSLGNPGHCENNNLANGQQCSSDVDCASGYCDTGGDNYYCRPKPPIDCAVSGWTNSGSCSATACGTTGTQKQTRTITQQPENGGAVCPSLTQDVACNGPACPTSCPVGQTLSGNACVPCPAGTYKNNTGTGACTPCTNSSTGRYVSAACTSTTDTQFAPFTTCSGGQYLSGSSSGSSSTLGSAGTCTNCTTIVPTGQYTKSVCSGTSDTQFAPFTTCSSGTWLLEAKAGSSTILGNPGRCTTDCTQTSIGTNPNSRPISGQCQVVQSALPTCPTDFAYINFNYALYGKPAQNKCINRWCSLTPL